MNNLYSKLDNFFNCCNVPLSVIDLNSNFLYTHNLNTLWKNKLLSLDIINKITEKNLNSSSEFISEDLKIVAIPFTNNTESAATFLLLGPYTLNEDNTEDFYYISCEKGLTYFVKLLKLFLSYKNTCSLRCRCISYN